MLAKSRLSVTIQSLLLMFATCSKTSFSQAKGKTAGRRSPDLAITISPEETHYGLHEEIGASCELTNLTDETLCFPPPEDGCYFSMSASLLNPNGTGGVGLGSGCGSEQSSPLGLISDLEQRWVKLSPNQTRLTHCLSEIELPSTGTWTVYSTYHAVKLTSEESSNLEPFGCRVPKHDVRSRPIKIEIEEAQPK
jgi:hypothetical protein